MGATAHHRSQRAVGSTGGIGGSGNTLPSHAAVKADTFADSVGVVTHFADSDYADYASARAALLALGVRHIRDKVVTGNTRQRIVYPQLQADGIKLNGIVVTQPKASVATASFPSLATLKSSATSAINEIATRYSGFVASIEGPNEPNISATGGYTVAAGNPRDWWDDAIALQQHIWTTVKATSALNSSLVVSTTPGARKDFAKFGNLSAYCDRGNVHHYPGGHAPNWHLAGGGADILLSQQSISGTKPIFATETGPHDLQHNSATGHPWTPNQISAYYAPRTYFDHFYAGVRRCFMYELYDEGTSTSDHEDHFGFFTNTWGAKSRVAPVRRVMDLFNDPTDFTPTPLQYEISSPPNDLRQLLFQKSNGHWLLCLWRPSTLWTATWNESYPTGALTVSPYSVTVNLGQSRTVNTYRPSSAAGVSQTDIGVSGKTVSLSNEVIVLEIF